MLCEIFAFSPKTTLTEVLPRLHSPHRREIGGETMKQFTQIDPTNQSAVGCFGGHLGSGYARAEVSSLSEDMRLWIGGIENPEAMEDRVT